MKHKLTKKELEQFDKINKIAGDICKNTTGSEVGGAYDLARHIQYAIYNVLEENGNLIWKVD